MIAILLSVVVVLIVTFIKINVEFKKSDADLKNSNVRAIDAIMTSRSIINHESGSRFDR